jgi:hypothetical protein
MTATLRNHLLFVLAGSLALGWGACSGSDSTGLTMSGGSSGGTANTGGGAGDGGNNAGASGSSATTGASGNSGTSGNGGTAGATGSGGASGGGASGGAGASGSAGASGAGGMVADAMADTSSGDSSMSPDSSADTGVADAGGAPDASDGGCPALVLGGATENVYVDKAVAQTGNGTIQCPFKTIYEASNLAAPAVGVNSRTIRVKGNAALPDYNETQAIALKPNVTLTSDYDASNPGGVTTVRVIGHSDCTTYTGVAGSIFCTIAMDNDSRLEKVTVRVTGGSGTGSDVVTTSTLPGASSVGPAIADVNAENAPEVGFRIYGSATLGPRVMATNNKQGLAANRGNAAALATIDIIEAAGSGPTNSFSSNTFNGGGNGFSVFGNFQVTIEGAYASNNTGNGIVIGAPYTSTTGVAHHLTNVHADNNGLNGLRVLGGEVHAVAGSIVNTFNNNANGYGIEATTGDAIGDVRVILEPKTAVTGYSIAHQANGNHLAGVHLNRAQPPGPGANALPHSIASLEAKQNGSAVTGSGIFVEIVGASGPNQSSLILRGTTLLGNTGAGLRFQKGNSNTLDLGTAIDPGYNVFGDTTAANRNSKSGICYENVAALTPNQLAETDHWSVACPLNLGSGSFQNGVTTCGSNSNYIEITYTGATAPIPTVNACF